MIRRALFLFLSCTLLPVVAFAQQRDLTLDDIYDSEKRIRFNGAPQSGLAWIDDARIFWPKRDADAKITAYTVLDLARRTERPLFDRDDLVAQLEKGVPMPKEAALKLVRDSAPAINASYTAALVTAADDLFVYHFATRKLTRLTTTSEKEEEPLFSPDGAHVAFLRGNDIFVAEVATARVRAVTTGGTDTLLNGRLDYVYQEEIYGRGRYRAFWWSPDSKRLAYLQLDVAKVPVDALIDETPVDIELKEFRYSEAGDPNAMARLFVADVATSASRRIDVDRPETLIVDVTWAPDGALLYQIQDREQRWIELHEADPARAAGRLLLREESRAWVDHQLEPSFMGRGSVLWLSERSGWRHIYELPRKGGPLRQITTGEWEVRDVVAYDAKNRWIYFTANAASPVGLDLYRIRQDGSGFQRLSTGGTVHEALFNPSRSMYVERWSDIATPVRVHLRKHDGSLARTLHENRVPELASFRLSAPRFVQIRARDGFALEAALILPPEADGKKRYPVYQYVYAGPRAQNVQNEWHREEGMFWQLLAQRGIIVFLVDNRSASGKGRDAAFSAYMNLGASELRDFEDAAAWLKSQSYVDPKRMLMYGWSYGGFMTTYALTHSTTWSAGIAGAPVTDWRTYDSIYTERYMRTPANNPEGYDASSVVTAAENLQGALLLIHGDFDDNVHPQNTKRLADALQRARKPFEMMFYPRARHTIRDRAQTYHIRMTMLGFIDRQLLR